MKKLFKKLVRKLLNKLLRGILTEFYYEVKAVQGAYHIEQPKAEQLINWVEFLAAVTEPDQKKRVASIKGLLSCGKQIKKTTPNRATRRRQFKEQRKGK